MSTHNTTTIRNAVSNRASLWVFLLALSLATVAQAQTPARWKAHDMTRPRPAMVKSGLSLPVPPPSDAIVLFDGKDLSKWRGRDGGPLEMGYQGRLHGVRPRRRLHHHP